MKEHKWEKKLLSGTELYGKTLGVMGFGRIGQEVAKRALAFGMNVIAFDIIEVQTDLDAKQVSWEELLSQADIITLHLPLTDKTRHMISDKEFAMMKEGVIIINASRGGTVDEKALKNALDSDKVRAAALDVFEKEPPDEFSLVDHPNVIATPHIGAAAKEGQKRAGMEVVSILKERLT
jgi:D-3-phosphoglycerate dehydrogenase